MPQNPLYIDCLKLLTRFHKTHLPRLRAGNYQS
jgi:hypothetical protein